MLPLIWWKGLPTCEAAEDMALDNRWLPEHELWGSVLLLAIKDFLEGKRDVEGWFLNWDGNTYEPGGFVWVCEHLDLDHLVPSLTRCVQTGDRIRLVQVASVNRDNWRTFRLKREIPEEIPKIFLNRRKGGRR
jgi:hypothetical protein